jgi:hypothetical protein
MERSNFGLVSLIDLFNKIQLLVHEPAQIQQSAPQPTIGSTLPSAPVDATQLDGASKDQLSSEDIEQIVGQTRPLDFFLERRLPNIETTTELADMRLDARTHNCITQLIVGKCTSESLRDKSASRRGFGPGASLPRSNAQSLSTSAVDDSRRSLTSILARCEGWIAAML